MRNIHYGLWIRYYPLTKHGSIHGITVFQKCQIPIYQKEEQQYRHISVASGTILIDARLTEARYEGRLRFTLAHELAHWIIHEEYHRSQGLVACKVSKEVDAIVEQEADALAAAMLMPEVLVRTMYHHRRETLNRESLLHYMAHRFQVSKLAMKIRLDHLGLWEVGEGYE